MYKNETSCEGNCQTEEESYRTWQVTCINRLEKRPSNNTFHWAPSSSGKLSGDSLLKIPFDK